MFEDLGVSAVVVYEGVGNMLIGEVGPEADIAGAGLDEETALGACEAFIGPGNIFAGLLRILAGVAGLLVSSLLYLQSGLVVLVKQGTVVLLV